MTRLHERYLGFFCLVLGGYAFLGRGFASVGVAPLYLGEVALGLGICLALASGGWVSIFATGPSVLLAALFAWTAVRAVPGIMAFGVLALRDAVIVGYGLFAMIVVSLVVSRPESLAWIVRTYGRFAGVFVLAVPGFVLAAMFRGWLPTWPVSQMPLVAVRPGEVAVHLAGAIVFALAGLRRVGWAWIAMAVLGVAVVSPSRGAMLACLLPVAAAVVLTGKAARFASPLLGLLLVFALAYVLDLDVPETGGRSMGPRQMVSNVESLIGSSDTANLDGTKAWRLGWWQAIEGYTFHGPYFWTGKGFGQSLAETDGFVVGEELGGPPLRSPHNANMTVLARMGVPGLVLWAATCGAWFMMMAGGMLAARRRGDAWWNGLFIWVACYLAAILIDASFDVALEGPMLGIWFWSLFGFGIAASMTYQASASVSDCARRRAALAAGPMPLPAPDKP